MYQQKQPHHTHQEIAQTGGNDLGVVDDQRVALLQIVDDIVKVLMLNGVRVAVEHHQATVIAGLDGVLGDTLLGQIIVKIRGRKRRCGTLVNDSRHEKYIPFSAGGAFL